MYPQIPVRTKVRILPYFIILVVGLGVLDDWGAIDLTTSTHAAKATHRHVDKATRASKAARADIPARYLRLYQQVGAHYRVPWPVLAGIGKVESDHGRSRLPGVRSGVNSFGCCAGPMQFNLRNGPPSTWDTYGHGSPYRPEDAIPAAARLLVANGARRNLSQALYSYNHSWSYVASVKALARRYQH
jgi:membrane-bound lytic murein transglycosylase B